MDGVGYGGKVPEQQRARELRAQSWTLQDIASKLGVSKSSVSLWVRDVEFVPNPRRRSHWTRTNPHPLHLAKLDEVERCHREGAERIGVLSEREFLVLGAALYAGEGRQDPRHTHVRQQRSTADSNLRDLAAAVLRHRRVEVSSEAVPPRGP
jgi:transcriptional regulator with XRE-family HTH domain